MKTEVPKITLNNGSSIPAIGFGTWFRDKSPEEITDIVSMAIENGYRLIDCVPEHEIPISKAIRSTIERGIVTRDDLYIVVKLQNTLHDERWAFVELQKKLLLMHLTYVDLYLLTWPFPHTGDNDYLGAWFGMCRCVSLGYVNSIGVCNFNFMQLHFHYYGVGDIKPAVLQIEEHINLICHEMLEFCEDNEIAVMSHSPFGVPKPDLNPPSINDHAFIEDRFLTNISTSYNKSNHQVALRYLVQLGTIPIPKASNLEHIQENIDIFDFNLSKQDMKKLKKLDFGVRTFQDIKYFDKKEYPFGYVESKYNHLVGVNEVQVDSESKKKCGFLKSVCVIS